MRDVRLFGLVLGATLLLVSGVAVSVQPGSTQGETGDEQDTRHAMRADQKTMAVHYLEIVTPAVEQTCAALAAAHAVSFEPAVAELGNARTATLKSGGRIGVRAPLRASEKPIVRPYMLVDDITSAVEAAKAAGAIIALPPMQIPGQGTFAIYMLGGIEHGLWQL